MAWLAFRRRFLLPSCREHVFRLSVDREKLGESPGVTLGNDPQTLKLDFVVERKNTKNKETKSKDD